MSGPNAIGQALGAFKDQTGWTWDQVAAHFGTTPTYARKLAGGAGKFGKPNAGASLAANVQRVYATGQAQAPVQRPQRVRVAGGATAPAPTRHKPAGAPVVFRSAGGKFGAQHHIPAPARNPGREAARAELVDVIRRAARGRRRVEFVVEQSGGGVHPLGEKGGYSASRVLRGFHREGDDPFDWLAAEFDGRYSLTPGTISAVSVSIL